MESAFTGAEASETGRIHFILAAEDEYTRGDIDFRTEEYTRLYQSFRFVLPLSWRNIIFQSLTNALQKIVDAFALVYPKSGSCDSTGTYLFTGTIIS